MPAAYAPTPQADEHISELAYGGISDDALYVELCQRDGRRENRSYASGPGDDVKRGLGLVEYRVTAGHHKYARGHHSRRMDQCGDRGGAFHRVRQPDMQRKLRGLPYRSHEEQERDDGVQAVGVSEDVHHLPDMGRHGREDRVVVQRAEGYEYQHHAEAEAEVADPVHDERLLARVRRGLLLVPEPDKEVGAKADRLPEHVKLEEVVRHDEHQHGEREQGEVGEEARISLVPVHVAGGIYMDERADRGDDDEHHGGQLVDLEPDMDVEIARYDPGVQDGVDGLPAHDVEKRGYGQRKRRQHRDYRRPLCLFLQPVPEQSGHDEGRQR